MSESERLNFYNSWPAGQRFAAEIQFERRCNNLSAPLFVPIALSRDLDKKGHISLSYILDALDSLPRRPDHAFDWTWKAFEHLVKHGATQGLNITEALRSYATPVLDEIMSADKDAASGFNALVQNIPMQTARFLLKKVVTQGPYVLPSTSFAKRMLYANGNGAIQSSAIQALLDKLFSYDYSNPKDRRNGASLIRRAVSRQPLTYPLGTFTLSQADVIFLMLSGLGYTFRNDRTHANSISPFASSKARIKTYSHCWFSFLVMYYLLSMLWSHEGYLEAPNALGQNYTVNNSAYTSLFSTANGK